jgi:hypothetical protein
VVVGIIVGEAIVDAVKSAPTPIPRDEKGNPLPAAPSKGDLSQNTSSNRSIGGSTPANPPPPPGPPRSNQSQNRQTDEASRRYNLSAEGREVLHRDVSGMGYGRNQIFEAAKAIAELGGKYVIR